MLKESRAGADCVVEPGRSLFHAIVTSQKNKAIVGLDIEAGSIAATEVQSNGNTR